MAHIKRSVAYGEHRYLGRLGEGRLDSKDIAAYI
jgi:hypothetical protein